MMEEISAYVYNINIIALTFSVGEGIQREHIGLKIIVSESVAARSLRHLYRKSNKEHALQTEVGVVSPAIQTSTYTRYICTSQN